MNILLKNGFILEGLRKFPSQWVLPEMIGSGSRVGVAPFKVKDIGPAPV